MRNASLKRCKCHARAYARTPRARRLRGVRMLHARARNAQRLNDAPRIRTHRPSTFCRFKRIAAQRFATTLRNDALKRALPL
eukprot:8973721-Lingulodinium_polyedra.AAC.1